MSDDRDPHYERMRREFRKAASYTFLIETMAELTTALHQLTVEVRDLRREVTSLRGGSGREDTP